jgi:non-heme chloroperoxidase
MAQTKSFTTNDGVTLHYTEAGSGQTIVLIPGWSQSAAEFRHQMALADRYHLIVLELRGHGESAKPAYGYRMHRLAKDVHDLLIARDLRDVTLLGHSMGASVIFGYWDLFRAERVARIVVTDQLPVVVGNPGWPQAQRDEFGTLWDPNGLYDLANQLAGADGAAVSRAMVGGMFTPALAPADLDWIVAENLKFPREHAARMLIDHCVTDWRDLFATITVPTLLIAGEASFFKPSALRWIHEQIAGSRLEVFGADEGGSHFMFFENPTKFNALVSDFVG